MNRVLLWTLCVTVTGGCGTKVIGLRSDPSFTYETLSSGGITVGGVTSLVGADDLATQQQMANQLRVSILKERSDIAVQPGAELLRALGEEVYDDLLWSYRLSGEIAETWLEQLWLAAAGDVRYVIFARIERDETVRDRVVALDSSDVEVTTFKISRSVGISFLVYDLTLTNGASVWSGSIDKTEKKSRVHRERGDILTSVVEAVLGLNKSGYPSPPEFSKLSREVFEGFADNLPEGGH